MSELAILAEMRKLENEETLKKSNSLKETNGSQRVLDSNHLTEGRTQTRFQNALEKFNTQSQGLTLEIDGCSDQQKVFSTIKEMITSIQDMEIGDESLDDQLQEDFINHMNFLIALGKQGKATLSAFNSVVSAYENLNYDEEYS